MRVIMQNIRVCFLVLTVAVGAALAQDPPTSGILRAGALEMLQTSSQVSLGPPLGTIESSMDTFVGGFSSTDLSKVARTGQVTYTTIGSCIVAPLGQQQDTTPDTGAVTY